MADDLVARLRNPLEGDQIWTGKTGLFSAAADEIERLRANIKQMSRAYEEWLEWQPDDSEALSRG